MVKVILKRGHKGDLTYEHPDMKSAMRRIYALVDLHSAHMPDTDGLDVITVDASHYYDKTPRKDPE